MVDIAEYCRFRDGFAAILDERFYYIEWLDRQVISGAYKLLTCRDAAVLVEIKTYPTGEKEAHGVAATGNMDSIVSILIPLAEKYGREADCIIASIESRPGWVRALRGDGYTPYQTCIRKEL